MEKEDGSNFVHHYQSTLFKENNSFSNSSHKAQYKRQSLSQIVLTAHKVCSNETSCNILKNKLHEYSGIVDKHDGVNNYASGVLDQITHTVNDAQKWSSEAKASDLLQRYLKPSDGECLNSNKKGGCNAQKPTLDELCEFLKTKKPVTSNDVSRNNSQNSILENCKQPNRREKSFLPETSGSRAAAVFPSTNKPVGGFAKRPPGTAPTNHQASTKVMSVIDSRVFGTRNNQAAGKPQPQKQSNLPSFRTAGTELKLQNLKKYGQQAQNSNCESRELAYGNNKKSLGGRTRSVNSKFVPPIKSNSQGDENSEPMLGNSEDLEDESLRLIDPKMVELIRSEIMDHGPPVSWTDIAGLTYAKATIQEIVVLPMLRPDIFTGLRRPPKGILLFGPPGTGKTLIGKCIASQSQSTFFNISASSLTSKWVGEGEKMVRTLFTLARFHQPAVVFIDEIDSLLSQRSETEHESSRRIKTEFLVQLDGAGTGEEDRILVIGATNRPQELDEAARRRLVKRLYIPLPDHQARCQIVENLMKCERNSLTSAEVEVVASLTDGYSGADMKTVCQEACLGPIRSISFSDMQHIAPDQVRPVTVDDFKTAISRVRSSVSSKDLDAYVTWDQTYGSGGAPK